MKRIRIVDGNHPHSRSAVLWNIAVDEYDSGFLSRRDLVRYAGLLGLTGLGLAQAVGLSDGARAAGSKAGGTVRIALDQPAGAIDPVTAADQASVGLIGQTGEYLVFDDPDKGLQPALALTWAADATCTLWTFKLRAGVKFHDGTALTAKDVVATFDRLVDPASGSAALSAYKGFLSKGAIRAVDDQTVSFALDAPNFNFPFYVSSDVYSAVILPANYAGNYEKTFIGTGPFRLEAFRPRQGASFVRNPGYWGEKALPDRIEMIFYDDPQAQFLALQAGQLDVIPYSPRLALALGTNPSFKILSIESSAHHELHMRTDQPPFRDKRLRRALALSIDREALVKGLLKGRGTVGNDSPFAPVFASSNPEVPQRRQDLVEAKHLLAQAGLPKGFQAELVTERAYEIPDYAVLVQNFAKRIGIDIKLRIEPQEAYYGSAKFGNSDWLDSNLGITDYGHRGTPDIVLNATLKGTGTWNAAHFKNAAYDTLLSEYSAARDLKAQRLAAGKIQTLLLDETRSLSATSRNSAVSRAPGCWTFASLRSDISCSIASRLPHEPGRSSLVKIIGLVLARAGLLLLTLWLVSMIVFAVGQVLPGDVGRTILGPFADADAVAALNHRLGTDRPIVTQYLDWLAHAATGDFGTSLAMRMPVTPLLLASLKASAGLAGLTLLLVIPIGIGLGVVAGLRSGSWTDRVITLTGLSAAVIPDFVSALILMLVFAVWLRWLPLSGVSPAGSGFWVGSYHLILPATPLVLNLCGYIARMSRAGMIEALRADYTRTAILKGLPPGIVLFRHVLRNALVPTITVIATQSGYLLGGLVVIESLFGIQGLGSLVLNAARARDFPMLEAGALVMATIYTLSAAAGDLLQSVLDPRLRPSRTR
jgi:peptide/nickel transport system substrate-binding protein